MQKKIIAHRGNLDGPNPERENRPKYIRDAIDAGFDVEVDVWFIDGKWKLGHDAPMYRIAWEGIASMSHVAWLHCKNIEAMSELWRRRTCWPYHKSIADLCYFWHQNDDVALTSCGKLWTFPGKLLTLHSIAVMPEREPDWDLSLACGICTDYPRLH